MKESAKRLTAAELEELALHVEFLRHTADPNWRQEMLDRSAAAGRLWTQEEVLALHERLIAEGK